MTSFFEKVYRYNTTFYLYSISSLSFQYYVTVAFFILFFMQIERLCMTKIKCSFWLWCDIAAKKYLLYSYKIALL